MRLLATRLDSIPLAAVLAVIGIEALVIGFAYGPLVHEDAQQYGGWAQDLIDRDFDYFRFMREIEWLSELRFYLAWISIVAVLKIIAGAAWPKLLVAINAGLLVLMVGVLLSWLERRGTSRGATVILAILIALQWDYVHWVASALADIAMTTVVVCVLVLVHKAVLEEDNFGTWAAALICAVLSIVLKPQGIALFLFFVAAAMAAWFLRKVDGRMVLGRVGALFALMVVALGTGLALYGFACADPSWIPDPWWRKQVEFEMRGYAADGSVVWQRYETYVDPPVSAGDYIGLVVLRMVYMFACWGRDYSMAHKLVNLIGLVPLYFAALLGFLIGISGRAGNFGRIVAVIAPMSILAFTLLHAMTAIDYDWRYRVPIYPSLFILAGIAIGFRGKHEKKTATLVIT